MNVEFTKQELSDLDMALVSRLIVAKTALRDGRGDAERLQKNIERLDILHKKLADLIEHYEA